MDEQARYLEATVGDGVRVATIYLPNGNPVASEKYPYKLAWMERLKLRAAELLACERPVVLGGDCNVIPTDDDVHDPARSEEHTSELQSLMRISYAVFCLKKQNKLR